MSLFVFPFATSDWIGLTSDGGIGRFPLWLTRRRRVADLVKSDAFYPHGLAGI